MSLCVGSTRRVLARQPAVLGASPRVLRAFSLRGERPGQPEARRPLHGRAAPFPSAAPACAAGRVSGSLSTGRGLFAGWERVASLGLSFPLSPPPAPYLQQGWGGSSLQFLSPFVLRTAGSVFRPVNFSSLSHSLKKSPSDCSQGLLAGLMLHYYPLLQATIIYHFSALRNL